MTTRTKRFVKRGFTMFQKLQIELVVIFLLLSIGSLIIHEVEGKTLFDSLYFSVITLSGVGYGDIYPITPIGKIVSMVYGLIGVPLFVVAGGFIVEMLKDKIKEQQ